MKTWHKLVTLAVAVLLTGGCTSAIVRDAATKVAGAQCSLPLSVRIAERKFYYEANGGQRLLVGMCKGDKGYDEFVQKYLHDQQSLLDVAKEVGEVIENHDFESGLEKLVEHGVELDDINLTEDGCIQMKYGKFCPNKSE